MATVTCESFEVILEPAKKSAAPVKQQRKQRPLSAQLISERVKAAAERRERCLAQRREKLASRFSRAQTTREETRRQATGQRVLARLEKMAERKQAHLAAIKAYNRTVDISVRDCESLDIDVNLAEITNKNVNLRIRRTNSVKINNIRKTIK